MPSPAPHPCSDSTCSALLVGKAKAYPKHAREKERWRGSAASRGYGAAHRKMRARVLKEEPICRRCSHAATTVADHIVPREEGGSDERSNYQGLCKTCHDIKTATEDGGFGRARQCGVVIVCGPPGAGKSTLVKQSADAMDLVLDLDRLAAALSAAPPDGRTGVGAQLLPFACEARDAILTRLARPHSIRRAWVVTTAPRPEDRERLVKLFPKAEVLVLEVSPDECLRRLQRDPLRASTAALLQPVIHEWWQAYRRRPAGERWLERGATTHASRRPLAGSVPVRRPRQGTFFSGGVAEGPQGASKRATAKFEGQK